MTTLKKAFKPNQEDVTSKVIDDELIIVKLSDGTYYSVQNVGTRVWELIESGYDVSRIIQTISRWYQTSVERVTVDIESLIKELIEEQLIIESSPSDELDGETIAAPEGSQTYAAPLLDIYRDMGNLLALDPPTPGIDDLLFRSQP